MIQLCLVGAGRVATTHAAVLREIPEVEIVAVVDPRLEAARALSGELGAQSFASLAEALTSAPIDAVDIITPHHLHHSLAAQALRADVHVFMDKPIATTVADGRALCELAEQRNLVLAICHNLMFHQALHRALELVRSGLLGRPSRANGWSSGWLDLPPWDFRLDREATGGGCWVDGAPHLVYVLEACLGPIETLHAALSRTSSRLGGEDTAVGQALFASGAVATLAVGYSDCPAGAAVDWPDGWQLGVELVGTDGRITVGFLPRARVTWQRKQDDARVEELVDVHFEDGFSGAIREFVQAVTTGAPLIVSPRDSLRNLDLVRTAAE